MGLRPCLANKVAPRPDTFSHGGRRVSPGHGERPRRRRKAEAGLERPDVFCLAPSRPCPPAATARLPPPYTTETDTPGPRRVEKVDGSRRAGPPRAKRDGKDTP